MCSNVRIAFGSLYSYIQISLLLTNYAFNVFLCKIKPSLHNTIDSCYSTNVYISNMFRPYLAIIRLTTVSIN